MNAAEADKVRNPDRRYVESAAPHLTKTRTGEKVTVRLVKNFGLNTIGDVCGFDPAIAKELVARGAAEYYKPNPAHADAIKARAAKDAKRAAAKDAADEPTPDPAPKKP